MCKAVKVILWTGMLVISQAVYAQSRFDDSGYPFTHIESDYAPVVRTDTTLFYRAVQQADDLYARLADYSLSFVAGSRRGTDYTDHAITYAGLRLPSRHAAAFRLLRADRQRIAPFGSAGDVMMPLSGGESFSFAAIHPDQPTSVSVNFTDRGYTAGARALAAFTMPHGWSLDLAVEGRTGRDMHVDGVFTSSCGVSFRLARQLSESRVLSLLASFRPSMRGMRTASVREAFVLRDDNLYNPSWGMDNGRVRNSRVRREATPLFVISYEDRLSDNTALTASLAAEFGTRRYSSLGWYDARTPMPDNYRYLPSYMTDDVSAGVVADSWRTDDRRYTQIDWDELRAENRMASGEAVYAVEDRVTAIADIRAAVGARTDFGDGLAVSYGAAATVSSHRSYRQMRDLLGASYLTDIDLYLVDDDTFSNALQNDLRHPGRRVGEGGRFGYDYSLRRFDAGLYAAVDYRSGRFNLDFAARLAETSVSRRGFFEKELFPGEGSFGTSPSVRFTTYAARLTVGYAFTTSKYVGMSVSAAGDAPEAEDLFWNPQYNNLTVGGHPLRKRLGWEAVGRISTRSLQLQASLFASIWSGEIMTMRYYDDLSSSFCDMYVKEIGRLCYGAEAAASLRLSRRWRLEATLTAARCKYSSNPVVEIITDAGNTPVAAASRSYLGGCTLGNTPQLAASFSAAYYSPRGWSFDISAGWAGARYVEPSLLRRTERVAYQSSSSHEDFDRLTNQERLDDAVDVGLTVAKRWRLGSGSNISVMLAVHNLAGMRDMVYAGYESQRVRRVSSGAAVYLPLPSRYLYSYPRTAWLSVNYTF